MSPVRLPSIAKVIRSKNAGPFELTLDIIFADEALYRRVRDAGSITREVIARCYGISVRDVLRVVHYDPALAVKATLARRVPSGSPGDSDVYGAQQHAPLLDLEIPDHVVGATRARREHEEEP